LLKLRKNDAEKFVHDLTQKIFENKSELLTFKLCQICCFLKAKKLNVFGGSFEKYAKEIKKFILKEKSPFFRDDINGLLNHLL
jgi:hypothetical protein